MDPNLNSSPLAPVQGPGDLKTKITETSAEFVHDNYEGFLRRLVNLIFALLKFLKNSILSMINMALGRSN